MKGTRRAVHVTHVCLEGVFWTLLAVILFIGLEARVASKHAVGACSIGGAEITLGLAR